MDRKTLEREGIPGKLAVGKRNTNPGEPYEIAIIATEITYCPFVALPCGNGESGKTDAHPALTEANARRLVACWNACAGIPTEQLERGSLDMALLSTLADIRAALGVGEKPMLSELAGIVARSGRDQERLMEALTAYADDEDRYNRGEGEPYGSIPVEVGAVARHARASFKKAHPED